MGHTVGWGTFFPKQDVFAKSRRPGSAPGPKEVAREEERRRDEGPGEGAKVFARTAGGEAAGARVIGG